MNLEELQKNYKDLYEQAKEEGRQEAMSANDAESVKAGARHEAEQAILSAIASTLGVTAEQKVRAALEAELSPEQARLMRDMFSTGEDQAVSFESKVNAYQRQHGCSRSEALKAVIHESPELHAAWLEHQQAGQGRDTQHQILQGLKNAAKAQQKGVSGDE